MPHQHPAVLAARLSSIASDHAVYVWPDEEPRCLFAFRRSGDHWRSVFPGAPVLADRELEPETLRRLLGWIARDLDAAYLYFPLAYPETAAAGALAAVPGMAVWNRSHSPVIDWEDQGHGILNRFHDRHGSQARRKARRWRKALRMEVLAGNAARSALADIEGRSWKASVGLDLASEGQLGYYQDLLDEGVVRLSAAMLDGRPIAYRLDARHDSTVYALEWSFDARFGRYAPGMFLMVDGLPQCWADADLERVDLFGSPDTLKQLLATGTRERVDLAWPSGSAVHRLRHERQAHDARLRQRFERGIGLAVTYGGRE
ncbi:GNAT family N-acetyltransferase [Nocardiopsis sp. LOL_012]|uniref:GNAT family N-acetyltransferase n=1 Tax=Nocardiopsis sp. LOL_012 TaxID=3345409 RepID=UPI003A85DC66